MDKLQSFAKVAVTVISLAVALVVVKVVIEIARRGV
jgi:hypothetical protein